MNRKYTQLTDAQRYQMEAYLKVGKRQNFIAKLLGVSESTISRERKRNCTARGNYNAKRAKQLCDERKERFGRNRRFTQTIRKHIEHWLTAEQWSPEQIVGYCNANNIEMVSIERIYQYIRQDRAHGGSLYKNLRHRLKHRKRPVGRHMPVKNRTPISQRPAIIDNKGRFGDWEIDSIIGKGQKGAIVTIVERSTAFLMIRKLKNGKDAKGLAKELIQMLLPYKNAIFSITSDNGCEFAQHKQITKKLETQFFFADPYCSWQRGLNEYSNKLIRQYIPKGTDFNQITDKQIKEIQHKINRRPRKKLNYDNPKNQFYKLVA